MNGVMPNQQYMPSPHRLSKRICLYHASNLNTKNSQEHGLHEYSNEDINTEVYKTTHVRMGDCKLTNRGHVFPLASRLESCFDRVSGFQNGNRLSVVEATSSIGYGHEFHLASSVESSLDGSATFLNKDRQTVVENSKSDLKSEYVTNRNGCSTFKRICDDDKMQSVRCFKAYLQTDTHTESVQSPFDANYCSSDSAKSEKNNVASVKLEPACDRELTVSDRFTLEFEKSLHCKRQNVASTKPETKCDILLTASDTFTSHFMPRSLCEMLCEQKSFEVVEKSYKLKDTAAILGSSVNISNKLVYCILDSCEDETKEIENKTSQCVSKIDSEDSLSYKNSLDGEERSNVSCDLSENVKTAKIKPKTKNMLFKNLNSESRIPRQTHANIVTRLPDYKQFSNVFQKAVRNAKQHRNYFQNSPVASPQSSITFPGYLKNRNLNAINDKNSVKKWQLHILKDMKELDEFLDYVSSKISELILVIRSITKDIQLLDVQSEDISVPLHYIQNTHFFNENKLLTSTRSEMLELGGNLLKKIRSLEHKLKCTLKAYKHSVAIVSRSLYTLCSVPIETKVIHERETVFGLVDKMDKLIQDIEVSENVLEVQRARNLQELQISLKKFHDMDSSLDEIC